MCVLHPRGGRALRGGCALQRQPRRATAPRAVVQRDADEAGRAADDGLRRDLVPEDGDGDPDEQHDLDVAQHLQRTVRDGADQLLCVMAQMRMHDSRCSYCAVAG